MSANAGHVFVSHSSDNRELANELAGFLEAKGVTVWIAPRDVRPGMDYSEELQLAIERCAAFVVLVTDMANKSPYVRAETEMAFSSHKPIFPVRIGDIQPAAGLALFLKIRHWTDAYGPGKSQSLERLTRELQALSAAAAPPAQQEAPAAAAVPSTAAPPPPVPAPPPPAPLTPEQEESWRAAVGPNADYYLERWRQMDAKRSAISWNWPACAANLFWFAYRKMWLPMAGLIAVFLLLGLVGAAGPTAAQVTLFASIGLTFVTGAFGNHLYRRQVARLVAEAPAGDRQAALEQLSARGGVSVPALVVSIVAVGLVTLLLIVAAAVAIQQQAEAEGGNAFDAGYDPGEGISGETQAAPVDGVSGEIGGEAPAAIEGDKPTE